MHYICQSALNYALLAAICYPTKGGGTCQSIPTDIHDKLYEQKTESSIWGSQEAQADLIAFLTPLRSKTAPLNGRQNARSI